MVFAGTGVWKSRRGTTFLGRRCVFINDEQYGYNIRDELIAADEVSYAYDDIGVHAPTSVSEVGNRTTAEGKTYTANNLNQYTAIDGFAPQYDDDGIHAPTSMSEVGNQTLIKTEPIATRPLVFQPVSGTFSYYFHDGNKNGSDLVPTAGSPILYTYIPFGISATFTSSENPYRFSSEYMDNTLSLVYYNYRHYNPQDCRWTGREPFYMTRGLGLYLYNNNNNGYNDLLGLYSILCFAYNEGTIIGVNSTNRNDETEVKNVFSGNEYANDSSKQHVTDKGPIPIGEYWLGNKYIPKNHIDDAQRGGNYNWYKLYGDNGMGGKSYTQVAVKNPETGKIIYRGGFNLHTGQASNGCVTVWSDIDSTDSRYPQSKQYDHLEKFLDKCSTKKFVNPRNPNDNYVGVLLIRKCLNDCREAINDYGK